METIQFISLAVGTLLFWFIVWCIIKNPHRKNSRTYKTTVKTL